MTKEMQINEAVERLQLLDLHKNVLKDFKRGVVNYSERTPLGGILYYVDGEKKFLETIKAFEEEYGGIVYHCTHENTEFGELLTMLYVSKHEDEWETDRKDLTIKYNGAKILTAYVKNLTFPELSEFGSVALVERGGGLIRVG